MRLGAGYVQTTMRKTCRWSTAQGYLRGRMARSIDVKTCAPVERINDDKGQPVPVTWNGPQGWRTTAPTR